MLLLLHSGVCALTVGGGVAGAVQSDAKWRLRFASAGAGSPCASRRPRARPGAAHAATDPAQGRSAPPGRARRPAGGSAGTRRAGRARLPTAAMSEPVGRPPEAPRRSGRAAAGERVGDLADHDGGERRAGRRERASVRSGTVARPPAGGEQARDERRHLDHRLGRAEHAEDPERQRPCSAGARRGGGGRARRVGSSAPSARAGRMSVPMSRARICSTPSASGNRPPDSAQTTNGVSSATLSVRW